jgi:hypothetical protein
MTPIRKFAPAAVALATALFTSAAAAQLKPPRDALPTAPAAPSAQPPSAQPPSAQPASAPANAGQREKAAAGALAAAGWLLLLDRRDWGRAWEASSTVFRGTVPLAAWMDGIPKVREPLGPLVERTQAEAVYKTTLQGRPDGEYVTVVFDAKFERKQVQEVVTTVRDADGKWRVTGYSTR